MCFSVFAASRLTYDDASLSLHVFCTHGDQNSDGQHAEVLELLEQRNSRPSAEDTEAVRQQAAVPPRNRRADIEASLKRSALAGHPALQQFGLEIDARMLEVPARLLPAPRLEYGSGYSPASIASDGGWRLEFRSGPAHTRFRGGARLSSWALVNYDVRGDLSSPQRKQQLADFFRALYDKLRDMGLDVGGLRDYWRPPEVAYDRDLTEAEHLTVSL